MPLSEQEQRLLDEMERQLMHTDADVVHAGASRGFSYRNMLIGALLVLAGLAAILAGIALWNVAVVVGVIVGVLGFAAMVGGVILALAPGRGSAASSGGDRARPAPQSSPSSGGSFMDKMNDRWDRRQQG
ncbi:MULTISPECIES: DUF3040 domain-containing protein [Microbacterium]|uniref:DUF3040 domain-containing protein n=1 Tax=Microbacterium TaxID=33882 RepID=UPI0012B774C4|nr:MULTISPECIES: DUF3040 domain-containing protein [Microbacterium]MTE24398.1 DUF3040 domain-containing protein [Microbacterium sp. ZXX196]NHI16637.1 DUF3040 domain-containing protein [Microbacterium excoecariae]